MKKLLLSILLFAIALISYSQKEENDTTYNEIKGKFRYVGVSVDTVGSLIKKAQFRQLVVTNNLNDKGEVESSSIRVWYQPIWYNDTLTFKKEDVLFYEDTDSITIHKWDSLMGTPIKEAIENELKEIYNIK